MKKTTKRILISFVSLVALSAIAREYSADVAVYGGTSGGVTAAVAAARNGKSVILIEPSRHLGGMTAGGLGQVDAGRSETIGGLAGEYFESARLAHGANAPLHRVTPKIAEAAFNAMIEDAGNITVLKGAALRERDGVEKKENRIVRIHLANGDIVNARMFIDSSYEGDLIAQAGVSYATGREPVSRYNESAAGVRQLRTLRRAFDDEGKLLPELVEADPGKPGEGDDKTQAYNFRLCVTTDTDNQVKFRKPANYNPEYYRNLLENILAHPGKEKLKFTNFVSLGFLPGNKFDLNNSGWYSTDFVNMSWEYPEGSYARRAELHQLHREYVEGLLYFLANDPRLPQPLRDDVNRWGYAADEFTDNDNFPHQLYIREARRMIGEYVMTQHDSYLNHTKEDSIGMGSYMLDTHWVQKVLAPDGKVYLEGLLGHLPVRPYEISYRSIVPRRAECVNLFANVCMSASHVIYSSMRMEPVYMILGHAAGTAAALAIDGNTSVQDVPYAELKKRLLQEKQILAYPGGDIFPLASEIKGLFMDDKDAKFTGKWSKSSSVGPYVDGLYSYTPAADEATATATYGFLIPQDDQYALNICYAPMTNRATRAPIELKVNDKTRETFSVNMRKGYPGVFMTLGKYDFKKGDKVEVVYSNRNADGLVVADCVQLLGDKPEAVKLVEGEAPKVDKVIPPAEDIGLTFYNTGEILASGHVPTVKIPDVDADAVKFYADLILARVLPDGAINNGNNPKSVLIIPYFSNFCAIALVKAWETTRNDKYLKAAGNYLRWYAANIQEDGTVHDYKGGEYPDYTDSGTYDSADSYPTTFAYALWYYTVATGDESLLKELYEPLQKAMKAAIEVRQDDHLTFAKRDYKIKYFMDNIEVWYGVIACAKIEKMLNGGKFDYYAGWALELEKALKGFWREEDAFFEFAKGHRDLKRLYPGALANAFGILFLAEGNDGARKFLNRIDQLILKDNDLTTITFPTQGWLLLTMQKADHQEYEKILLDSIRKRQSVARERAHCFALMIFYLTGGMNDQYGIF